MKGKSDIVGLVSTMIGLSNPFIAGIVIGASGAITISTLITKDECHDIEYVFIPPTIRKVWNGRCDK